ncbi:hypothetical protein Cni_G11006 [Canna indica]|uniref:Uncharacterized protein n=1 Tax=Canna indica TaxID=4628 RepID=A0AAQ3K593_9LILI|nr:hypothetical protein Cni_G11006 [Canna indica]
MASHFMRVYQFSTWLCGQTCHPQIEAMTNLKLLVLDIIDYFLLQGFEFELTTRLNVNFHKKCLVDILDDHNNVHLFANLNSRVYAMKFLQLALSRGQSRRLYWQIMFEFVFSGSMKENRIDASIEGTSAPIGSSKWVGENSSSNW